MRTCAKPKYRGALGIHGESAPRPLLLQVPSSLLLPQKALPLCNDGLFSCNPLLKAIFPMNSFGPTSSSAYSQPRMHQCKFFPNSSFLALQVVLREVRLRY